MPQRPRHRVGPLGERHQLHATLHCHALPGEVLGKQPFGLALRDHERKAERALDTGDFDVDEPLPAAVKTRPVGFQAGPHEGLGQSEAVE